jgi:hypothetical protein
MKNKTIKKKKKCMEGKRGTGKKKIQKKVHRMWSKSRRKWRRATA